MGSRFYKIVFDDDIESLNTSYDGLSEHEKEKISDLEAITYFDYIEDNKYFFYVITSELEINRYTNILLDNLIDFKIEDISESILKNKINIEDDLQNKLDGDNIIKWDIFIYEVEDWILKNLTIDMVLDRISEVGIKNITEIENIFLKNYEL